MRPDGLIVEHAGRPQFDAFLEFAHGLGDLGVVMRIVGVLADAELGAKLRHARIFHRGCCLLLFAGRREFEHRALLDLDRRAIADAAQFGELRLQFAIELLRRVVAVERGGCVLGRRDIGQHFGRIGRVLGVLDVARDLRIVHPAALRLTRIVQHAVGQFEVGFGQRVRRGRGGKIRRRIIGGVQAVGGGILEARDDALGGLGQRAALGPQRREVARGVELFHRGAFGLAVEIA